MLILTIYLDLSTKFENMINEDKNLNSDQKIRLFKIINFEKNLFYVISKINKETWNDCMKRRLGDEFNNDHYLSQLLCMST